MSYLLAGDFDTHVYAENRDEITRSDNTILYEAIEAAIAEAKSYMARYDLLKIFGNDDTEPVVVDVNLKNKVKDLAMWHLCNLGAPNIKLEIVRTRYEDAIAWFKLVTMNKVKPEWPSPVDDATTDADESKTIEWDSVPARQNHY
jgi:phage gp36-like protein